MKLQHGPTWAILAAAGWLYLSPFILGFADLSYPAAALAWVCAVALTISASEALVIPDPIEEWVDAIAGAALIAGPWLFGFSGDMVAAVNSVIVGVLVTVFAFSEWKQERRRRLPAPPRAARPAAPSRGSG